MSRPSVLNGSEDTNLYEPIIENIQKNLGQFQSDTKYASYNFIQNNIQDPSLYQNNIDTSNLKTYEDFKYIVIPNNNGSTQGMYLTDLDSYLNHNFKDAQNIGKFASNCQIIKEYSLETLDFDKNPTFLVNFDYFVAPPEKGGNDANDGLTPSTPKETCAGIPNNTKVLYLPGNYTKFIKLNWDSVRVIAPFCTIGMTNKIIYGCGNLTVIGSSSQLPSERDRQTIFTCINPTRENYSNLNLGTVYNFDSLFTRNYGSFNVRNLKVRFHSSRKVNYECALHFYSTSTYAYNKNIVFEITGNYSYNQNQHGGSPVYQNCTFIGGSRLSNSSGSSTVTTAPDNEIDTLIKNTSFQPKKEITFHPQKQRYKPTYTLIPLVSSGYYDINENDLINFVGRRKEKY